ncbi:MAG: penicillin acylase family protein, partial [Luminiphilus sp.]
MQRRRRITLGRSPQLSALLFMLVASLAWPQTATAFEATIERDALGVPHIFGATAADMAFGLAYAQAEDGWEILEETLPYYRGQAA